MKKIILILIILLISAVFILRNNQTGTQNQATTSIQKAEDISPQQNQTDIPQASIIAENLDTPWAIAFLPDKSMLVMERQGSVKLVDVNGNVTEIAKLKNATEIGEGGLLGIALHPDFSENNYVYFYYTYSSSGDNTLNRVVRMTYSDKSLGSEEIIVDKIPGASNHNGGRIKFGPDGNLYITTGDAQEPSRAQDKNSLAGKILRVTAEGKTASGNPFNNLSYSYGHRNPQGIAWDSNGNLWSTEHGRSAPTGLDEINLIEQGKNYGWPTTQGDETRGGMETPKRNSGPTTTWAPAGAAFVGKSLFFAGLRGQTLYEAVIENNDVLNFKEHFSNEFGRIREVILGPDGMLYITTSNKDGRGSPQAGDDKIIRVNPTKLK